MGRKETVELTNMCMVEDGKGNVLVQNRLNPNWPGIVYPGGHVEAGESITASVVREVREETGLTVQNPTLCGVKQFWLDDGVRFIVFLFRADQFSGELHGLRREMRSGCRGQSFSSTRRRKTLRA